MSSEIKYKTSIFTRDKGKNKNEKVKINY